METEDPRSPMDRLFHPEEDLEELYRSWGILGLVGENERAIVDSGQRFCPRHLYERDSRDSTYLGIDRAKH